MTTTNKHLRSLTIAIPARLRPHIQASFAGHLGYGEKEAVIYLLQKALQDEESTNLARKLEELKTLLKGKP